MHRYCEMAAARRDDIMVVGLAVVPLVAGLWKLGLFAPLGTGFSPAVWEAYNPGWFLALLPVPVATWTLFTGLLEAGVGVALLLRWRTDLVAGLTAVWLFGVTVAVASSGFYDIALRDLGLAVFAAVVALNAYEKR